MLILKESTVAREIPFDALGNSGNNPKLLFRRLGKNRAYSAGFYDLTHLDENYSDQDRSAT